MVPSGAEASERQWSDLRGICQARGKQLDFAYMRYWSLRLLAEYGL